MSLCSADLTVEEKSWPPVSTRRRRLITSSTTLVDRDGRRAIDREHHRRRKEVQADERRQFPRRSDAADEDDTRSTVLFSSRRDAARLFVNVYTVAVADGQARSCSADVASLHVVDRAASNRMRELRIILHNDSTGIMSRTRNNERDLRHVEWRTSH